MQNDTQAQIGLVGAVVAGGAWVIRRLTPMVVRRWERMSEAHERAINEAFDERSELRDELRAVKVCVGELRVTNARQDEQLSQCRRECAARDEQIEVLQERLAGLGGL